MINPNYCRYWWTFTIIPALVAGVYIWTYPSQYLSDPFILQFPTITDVELFGRIDHLLSLPILYGFWLLLRAIGFNTEPLIGAQFGNLVLTIGILLLIYSLARKMCLTPLEAWLISGLLVFSFSCWAYASGELHHSGLFFLCASYLLLLYAFESGLIRYYAMSAATSALAVACHIELGTFPFVVFIGLLCLRRIRPSVVFLSCGLICGMALYGSIAFTIHGVRSPGEFADWIITGLSTGSHEAVFGFNLRNPLRLLKSQFSALYIGIQYVHDILRYQERWSVHVIIIILSSLTVVVLFMFALIQGIKKCLLPDTPHREFFFITGIWFLFHKITFSLFVNAWLPEFSLVTLLPLVLLCGLGLKGRNHVLFGLFILVFVGNLGLWVMPRKNETKAARQVSALIPLDDLNTIYVLNPQAMNPYIYSKDWCLSANGDIGVLEKGDQVMSAIDQAFAQKRRVFIFLRQNLLEFNEQTLLMGHLLNREERDPQRLLKAKETLSEIENKYTMHKLGSLPFRFRGHASFGYAELALYELGVSQIDTIE